MNQRLAISYARFSTIGQADGDSIRRQTEATEAYCKKHSLILTDKFRLRDLGKSAYKGVNRSPTGALGILEKQVEAGQIPKGTTLVVENLDRLSREDIVTAQLLLLNLIHKGIEIVALSDNERRYSKETLAANPMELMVSIMVMSRAHEESKTKSYRAKESWMSRWKQASEGKHINTKLPAWLESKHGKYVVIPEKAAVIRKIFAWYLAGYGTVTVTQKLTEHGIANIARVRQGRTDRWSSTYVQRILKSRELIGYYTKVSPEVPHFYPAVVSESDFYAVQAKLKERYTYKGQRNHTPHPFSHILKCALCGEGIVKASSNGYKYLECQGSRLNLCKTNVLPCYSTEQALLWVISNSNLAAFDLYDKAATDAQLQLDALQGKLKELNQKIATAAKLFLETPSEAGTKILQQLEGDRKLVLQEVENARNSQYLVDHRRNWKEIKSYLEQYIKDTVGVAYEVIPVTVKVVNGKPEFLRHEATQSDDDMIALRETLRSVIDRIVIDIPQMTATIHYKSGRQEHVQFKKSRTYPRTLYYKTDKIEWTPLPVLPRRQMKKVYSMRKGVKVTDKVGITNEG